MLQRKVSIALGVSVAALVILVGAWLTLNYFRVQYYNDSIEGPSPEISPYWTIIHAQNFLRWPIVVAGCCLVALVLFVVGHYVRLALFNGYGADNR